jgi:hypothetical protein
MRLTKLINAYESLTSTNQRDLKMKYPNAVKAIEKYKKTGRGEEKTLSRGAKKNLRKEKQGLREGIAGILFEKEAKQLTETAKIRINLENEERRREQGCISRPWLGW